MLIKYVVTEKEFQIETLFPKVCVIHPGCRAGISLPSYYHHPYDLHHHDPFTNSRSVPSLQLYCHHLHMELYYLLHKVLQCTPYRAPTKILLLLHLSPQRSMKAQTWWHHRSDPSSVPCQLPAPENSFSSSFGLLDSLAYGFYLSLQLPLQFLPIIPTRNPSEVSSLRHYASSCLCALACVIPLPGIPPPNLYMWNSHSSFKIYSRCCHLFTHFSLNP